MNSNHFWINLHLFYQKNNIDFNEHLNSESNLKLDSNINSKSNLKLNSNINSKSKEIKHLIRILSLQDTFPKVDMVAGTPLICQSRGWLKFTSTKQF